MLFTVKKIAAILISPLLLAMFAAVLAGALAARGRRRGATIALISSLAIIYLAALPVVADTLLGPLERRYVSSVLPVKLDSIRYIVVLGTGYAPDRGIPITGAFDEDGIERIVEGLRLLRQTSSAKLVVSGGARPGDVPGAVGYARLATDFGVAASSLKLLDSTLDTAAEARTTAALVGQHPFILVTAAYHMPRAVRLMELAGVSPIPAPTAQSVRGHAHLSWRSLLPSTLALRRTERALHEYAALAALEAGIT